MGKFQGSDFMKKAENKNNYHKKELKRNCFLDLENFPSIIQLQRLSHHVCALASLFYTDSN